MELGPKNIGYFLELNHSIDYVLGFHLNFKVYFPLMEVGSRKINYFLEPYHSIVEWGW